MIKLGNISFDHCIKCTICTVYCPVARATHHFPGPKQSGPDTERLRIKNPGLVDETLKYCSNCKRCEIACPSDVKIADIIQNARWNYLKKRFRLRDFFLSRTDFVGKFAVTFSLLINIILKFLLLRFFIDKVLGIPYTRLLPKYESSTFRRWFFKKAGGQERYTERVIYFQGCYVNYNNHSLGKDLLKVLNSINVGVDIVRSRCCGVPLIANGYIHEAKKNGIYNINSFHRAMKDRPRKIVTTSSSCAYALKYEYANLLELENSVISDNLEYITKYIFSFFEKGIMPEMEPLGLRAVYHAPCHLERMGGAVYTIEMLKRIPGLDLVLIHSECCGIAGTYGFKSEYYNISQKIGTELFKKIDQQSPEVVVTDCETCKMQIEMNTEYRVLHPINLLAMALKG